MRTPRLALLGFVISLPLAACGDSISDNGDDGAAHIGVVTKIEQMPQVMIDDEQGTNVRVFVDMEHYGGPDAETLEVVSASLKLDLEHYAELELAIPADHTPFPGLADGEQFSFELRGHIPDNHDDWGLCIGDEEAEGQRVSLDLLLRVTPGANDEADEFEFESLAVSFGCSHT
ncbi:MAG: hypothetical protein R6X02_28215, partial [Enhygromyxa sp.]